MVRTLAFVFLSIFSLHLALCFGLIVYLSVSIPLHSREFTSIVAEDLRQNFQTTDPAELSQLLEGNLTLVVSQHQTTIELLERLARPFFTLKQDNPHGLPAFNGDMVLLLGSAGVWGLLGTMVTAAILLLLSLIPPSWKKLPRLQKISTREPAVEVGRLSAQPYSLVRDLVGVTVVHVALSVLVFLLYFTASIASNPHPVLGAFYTLFQLPIMALVLPLALVNPVSPPLALFLPVLAVNSLTSAILALLAKSLFRKPSYVTSGTHSQLWVWIVPWSIAFASLAYAYQIKWHSLTPTERVVQVLILCTVLLTLIGWLRVLLVRSGQQESSFLPRRISLALIALIVLSLGAILYRPLQLFWSVERQDLQGALALAMKGGSTGENRFLMMGVLSAEPEPRFHPTSGASATIIEEVTPVYDSSCYFDADTLRQFSDADASIQVSMQRKILQLTDAEVRATMEKVLREARDGLPARMLTSQEIRAFVLQQKRCALRRLAFFGTFARSVRPEVESLLADPDLTDAALQSLRGME